MEKRMTNPKWVVFRSRRDGKFYFKLQARNGKVLLQSEGYNKKDSALNGISAIEHNIDAEIEDVTKK